MFYTVKKKGLFSSRKGCLVLFLFVLVMVLLPFGKSEAATIVYDPTNYAANIQTSLKQIESVANEIKMLENEAKNLMKLGQIPELTQFKSSISKLMELKKEVTGLMGSYESFQSEWDSMFKDFASINGMSGSDYAAQVKKELEALNKVARDAAKIQSHIKEEIDSDSKALDALLEASSSTTGALQAAQAGNQIAGVVAQQLLKLQTAMTASNQAQLSYTAYVQKNDEAAAARAEKFFTEYTKKPTPNAGPGL